MYTLKNIQHTYTYIIHNLKKHGFIKNNIYLETFWIMIFKKQNIKLDPQNDKKGQLITP